MDLGRKIRASINRNPEARPQAYLRDRALDYTCQALGKSPSPPHKCEQFGHINKKFNVHAGSPAVSGQKELSACSKSELHSKFQASPSNMEGLCLKTINFKTNKSRRQGAPVPTKQQLPPS